MRFYDDGVVGLGVEVFGGTIRFLPSPGSPGQRPPFVATAQFTRVTRTVAKVAGLQGKMSARHLALLVRELRAHGFRVLYVERVEGHDVPMGERIEEGDFAGMWRVDLEAAAARAQARYERRGSR